MKKSPQYLEKENKLLRKLLFLITELVTELVEKFPPELRELQTTQRLEDTMTNTRTLLENTEERHGPKI
jgi:hypothetical protein